MPPLLDTCFISSLAIGLPHLSCHARALQRIIHNCFLPSERPGDLCVVPIWPTKSVALRRALSVSAMGAQQRGPSVFGEAQEAASLPFISRRSAVMGVRGMVACSQPLAAEVLFMHHACRSDPAPRVIALCALQACRSISGW